MSYYLRDSFSIKSNQHFANFLADLILLSQSIQSYRQLLATIPYYDCISLFRLLDHDEKGYLIENDFRKILGQKHKKVVMYVFSWFDQTKMGQISRLEFISFLMPKCSTELQEIIAKRIEQPQLTQTTSLTQSTLSHQLQIFTQMLHSIISSQLKLIQQRHTLITQPDYSIKAIFNTLNLNNTPFVTSNDIYKFMQNYAIQVDIGQINKMLEIVDSKITGKITMELLRWLVEGVENKDKQYMKKVKAANHKIFNVKSGKKSRKNDRKQQQYHHSKTQQKYYPQQKNISSNNNHTHTNHSPTQPQSLSKPRQPNPPTTSPHNLPSSQQKFSSLLTKFKQIQLQTQQRDQQLLQNEKQISSRLRQQYYHESIAKDRMYTQIKGSPIREYVDVYQNYENIKDIHTNKSSSYSNKIYEKNQYHNDKPNTIKYQHKYTYNNSISSYEKNTDINKQKQNIISTKLPINNNDKYKANQQKINQIRHQFNKKNIQKYRNDLPHTETVDGNRYSYQKDINLIKQSRRFLEDYAKPFTYTKNQVKYVNSNRNINDNINNKYNNDIYVSKFAQNYPVGAYMTADKNKFIDIKDIQNKQQRQKQLYKQKQQQINLKIQQRLRSSKYQPYLNNPSSSSTLKYGHLYNTHIKQSSASKNNNNSITTPYDSNHYNDIRSTSKFGNSTETKYPQTELKTVQK